MSDTITLPREVVQEALEALEWAWGCEHMRAKKREAITALRTALAAPRLEVTVDPRLTAEEAAAISAALAAEQPKHPGYVIGSHWLETAYSRICAGEAEADVLRDIGLVREEAFLTGVAHLKAENEALRRDAEQGRWLREWLDNNGLLVRAIRGESLAGYEHPDIEALRRDAERLREAIEAYIRAKNSDGGGKGGFFPKPPTVAHQRRVHLAWQELNAALRREDGK